MSEPRPYTEDECREMLLEYLAFTIQVVLNKSSAPTAADKLHLLVHSILVMFDGASNMPAFKLAPLPHPNDADFYKAEGENWWPDDIDDLANGTLHDQWGKMRGGL